MVLLGWDRVISANVVEAWHTSLTSQFMNQLTFPEEHSMLLVGACLFELGSVDLTGLLFLNFIDLTKGTTAQLLNKLETAFKNCLTVL